MTKKKKKSKKSSKKSIQKDLNSFVAKKTKKVENQKKKFKKKEKKKDKRILKLVTSQFGPLGDNMVRAITKSVAVNHNLMKRDADAYEAWEQEYYNTLFLMFKKLIVDHNEKMKFDADKVTNSILVQGERLKNMKEESTRLRDEIKSLKTEKGILENA